MLTQLTRLFILVSAIVYLIYLLDFVAIVFFVKNGLALEKVTRHWLNHQWTNVNKPYDEVLGAAHLKGN